MTEGVEGRVPSIEEILAEMDLEVGRCRTRDERRGYFALVYRAVTERVRDGIGDGEFVDNGLMEQLDVVFATRWLDACDGWWSESAVTEPWDVAFEASKNSRLLVLQHLMLGINAHINLDLGIAAAETIDLHPELTIDDLRDDFDAINDVLSDLVDRMQAAVATVSPWMGWVDWVSRRLDEGVVGFAIEVARREAWALAVELAALPPDERGPVVQQRAAAVADLGRHIARPPLPILVAARVARIRETHDLDRVSAALETELKPST